MAIDLRDILPDGWGFDELFDNRADGKWYNPTNQERADREIKEELNGGRQ